VAKVPTSSYLANPRRLPIHERLNVRSQPIIQDPFRTPPRTDSPPAFLESSPVSRREEASVDSPDRFSLCSTSDMNVTIDSASQSDHGDDDGQRENEGCGVVDDEPNLDTGLVDAIRADQQEEEAMDWDDMDPGLLEELHTCRRQARDANATLDGTLTALDLSGRGTVAKPMLIVDTNVFIARLSQLVKLTEPGSFYTEKLVLYVPWTVLRELDMLKSRGGRNEEGDGLRRRARTSVNFLHKLLKAKSAMIRGQTEREERSAEAFAAHSADDRILQTCLKLRSEGKAVALLTNDKVRERAVHSLPDYSKSRIAKTGRVELFYANAKVSFSSRQNLANKAMVSQLEVFDSPDLVCGLQRWLTVAETAKANAAVTRTVTDVDATAIAARRILNGQAMMANYKEPVAAERPSAALLAGGVADDADDQYEAGLQVDAVNEVFKRVWHFIFVYCWQYCRTAGSEWSLPHEPVGADRTKLTVTVVESRICLPCFYKEVKALQKDMTSVLRRPTLTLTVADDQLTAFHRRLTTFLAQATLPMNHPSAPGHREISPAALLHYIVVPTTRRLAENGLHQLRELQSLSQIALTKLRMSINLR